LCSKPKRRRDAALGVEAYDRRPAGDPVAAGEAAVCVRRGVLEGQAVLLQEPRGELGILAVID
jgi:hypothetical protein